ncbi:NUDIX domain-containing protein [Marinagarivorans algicola]|uniref:NUDIX domain-containing protein n=1 Tax=Marinagarivorans algicola TaxID=1513270 RepID=UPI0006B56131
MNGVNNKKFTVLNKKSLYSGFLKLNRYTLQHSLHRGGMSQPVVREVMERGHAVAVLLHDPTRDEIVLVEQFRAGAIHEDNPWLTELVAGMVEPEESLEDVARREAEEESGAQVGELEFIGNYFGSVGACTEKTTLFYAQIDATQVEGIHGVAAESEDIRVVKLSAKQFLAHLDAPLLHTASLMIAGLWFKVHKC